MTIPFSKGMLFAGASAISMSVLAVPIFAQSAEAPAGQATGGEAGPASSAEMGDIVVTARKRSETLLSVPVSVTALGGGDIARANAIDLPKMAEIVPSVIISNSRSSGGGSIAIRGISSPSGVVGFEQSVSVALDGVQTSNGKIAQVGIFDVRQIEFLKGPQALFFGKNSPAGVISVSTNGPTKDLQVSGSVGYEFVGDEAIAEAAISGPIGQDFGFRIAGRYRNLKGWLYNDSRVAPNPFATAAMPAGFATLPGAHNARSGNDEALGRLTLAYQPAGGPFQATLKVFADRYRDDGAGASGQNIGPCTGSAPRMYGIADPFGECKPDNHMTNGDIPVAVAQALPLSRGDGKNYGATDFQSVSLNMSLDLGKVNIVSLSGYNHNWFRSDYGLDNTSFSQLYATEHDRINEYSQEFRGTTNFDGPLNFVAGVYYQKTTRDVHQDISLGYAAYFNPANNRVTSTETIIAQDGRTISAFGQVLYKITSRVELAAGGRWTNEHKEHHQRVPYGFGAFNVVNVTFPGETTPGVLNGKYRENNFSPEATLTWHPTPDHTLYAAYKTGFKSGGFTAALATAATRITDLDFGSERVKGGELGAKGRFGKLRVTSAAFLYNFSNLQVNAFDPTRVAFIVGNAGSLKQRGFDLELQYQASRALSLHTAATYAHNRFSNYVGPCYAYAFPTGTTRATATPPPNCSFVNATALTLQQNQDGRVPARSPDFSGNAGFELNMPTGAMKVGLTGDVFYSDGYWSSDTKAPSTYQDSFFRFNASVSLAADNDRWRLAMIGRNLSNKYFLQYGMDRTGGASIPGAIGEQRGYVARGREVLLQASFRY